MLIIIKYWSEMSIIKKCKLDHTDVIATKRFKSFSLHWNKFKLFNITYEALCNLVSENPSNLISFITHL